MILICGFSGCAGLGGKGVESVVGTETAFAHEPGRSLSLTPPLGTPPVAIPSGGVSKESRRVEGDDVAPAAPRACHALFRQVRPIRRIRKSKSSTAIRRERPLKYEGTFHQSQKARLTTIPFETCSKGHHAKGHHSVVSYALSGEMAAGTGARCDARRK